MYRAFLIQLMSFANWRKQLFLGNYRDVFARLCTRFLNWEKLFFWSFYIYYNNSISCFKLWLRLLYLRSAVTSCSLGEKRSLGMVGFGKFLSISVVLFHGLRWTHREIAVNDVLIGLDNIFQFVVTRRSPHYESYLLYGFIVCLVSISLRLFCTWVHYHFGINVFCYLFISHLMWTRCCTMSIWAPNTKH